MKIVVIALKVLGIAFLGLLIMPLTIFIFLFIQSTNHPDSQELVHSQAFQHLHQLVSPLNSTRDITSYPDDIIIDDLAINLAERTFRDGRENGTRQSYLLASGHTFSSLNSLLAPQNLDSTRVCQIAAAMKTSQIVHIEITYKVITYRWENASWGHDEEGILYEEDDMVNPSQYKLYKAIAPHFYHYAR